MTTKDVNQNSLCRYASFSHTGAPLFRSPVVGTSRAPTRSSNASRGGYRRGDSHATKLASVSVAAVAEFDDGNELHATSEPLSRRTSGPE